MVNKVLKKIRTIGAKKTVKLIRDELIRPFNPFYYEMKWKLIKRNLSDMRGLYNKQRTIPIIVSLTTYPGRINGIHNVIKTLLMQSVKPDKIILWLANEQFPNKEDDLPQSLMSLCQYGLSVCWCSDIRSYKKLIPTLKLYPNSVIITVDDDMYYHGKMIEKLYKAFLKHPEYIHCHRVSKFCIEDGNYVAIPGGYNVYPHPSFLHKLTGGSGCCYPPNSLYKDIINEELFMNLTPTNDDIWFWLMGALNGFRCNVVDGYPALYFVKNSQNESLNSINDKGEKLFWIQFNNILSYYPQIDPILRSEWKRETKLI